MKKVRSNHRAAVTAADSMTGVTQATREVVAVHLVLSSGRFVRQEEIPHRFRLRAAREKLVRLSD